MSSSFLSLRQLFPHGRFLGCQDINVTTVTADSRRVTPGAVFVAVPGRQTDGHRYIDEAVRNGAAGIVMQRKSGDWSVPCCLVPCAATAFAQMSMAVKRSAAFPLICAGVTGTNGKTTTTWMLRAILRAARLQCGLIGTIENHDGVDASPATMTTPQADVLAEYLSRMAARQTSHCAMEVSSHALCQKRCAGIRFSAAAITNITQDHFDYHGTSERYRAAKAEIAALLHTDAPLLLNLNDEGCRILMRQHSLTAPVITFAVGDRPGEAELNAVVLSQTHRSQRVLLQLAQGDAELRLRLIGRHNVENALAAAGLAEQLGVRLRDIVAGLESVDAIPGRLERIDEGQPFRVLVDYAHTPDALRHTIATIRNFVPGRLISVFGAGGDRDRTKRASMGQAAANSDCCIVTSDNPRSEDPDRIISDIIKGIPVHRTIIRQVDRHLAIQEAFEIAEPGDVILIAGRGHETKQQVADRCRAFDDRVVARTILREMYPPEPLDEPVAVYSLPRSA